MANYSLPKVYDFKSVEGRLYDEWEKKGFFQPREGATGDAYVISMPPPNVTGKLHLGHAITLSTEDLMIRYKRMKGNPTLWVPGSDHAGIATKLQVEKTLLRTDGVTREEIGREEFIRRTWEWKEKYGGIITQQARRLGASCDWQRERFTLDDGLSLAVREAFVRLYEKGLIYRGAYLVNWSPGLQTAVSNLEVEYSEEEGTLYYFKYPVEHSEEFIPVATTRPETILGDTAVAIHPEDDRFRHLIGKRCLVPMLQRSIPVITDAIVDREFGTGALKITPGHDPADYEIGKRHGLEIISVFNPDATMNANAGPYEGLDRYACRQQLWKDMQAAKLALKTEAYMMQVPRSQRGGEAIEPMISTQWFVKMEPLAAPALDAVRQGRIKIIPERFTTTYFDWLENIRDWCISRQLWWGHQIPAWHCENCGEITVAREDPTECSSCGSAAIERDPDVLDTWFSSGLWPFSILGWPEKTADMERFYPTTMMETGYDILFFWVARMIMLGLEFTDDIPFRYVYLHGLVRDENGKKMSKSLGNVIDPLELIDEYGADALRFTLLTGSTPGQDMKFSESRVEGSRNFANKIWNAGRLVLGALANAPEWEEVAIAPTHADSWIQARLRLLIRDVNRLFENFQYGEAGRLIHEFFWSDYADWYLEIAKLQLDVGGKRASNTVVIMAAVFDKILRVLHPFIPFVTEELWSHLKSASLNRKGFENTWEEALIVAQWPESEPESLRDKEIMEEFSLIREFVRVLRNMRAEKRVEPNRRIEVQIQAGEKIELFEKYRRALSSLALLNPEKLLIKEVLQTKGEDCIPLVVGSIEVYVPLSGLFDAEIELARISKQMQEVRGEIKRLEKLLGGPFSDRAPDEIVSRERTKLKGYHETLEKLTGQKRALST